MNSVFFCLTNTPKISFFFILAVGFCLKNLAFARKIMALPESGGAPVPQPLWLVCLRSGEKQDIVSIHTKSAVGPHDYGCCARETKQTTAERVLSSVWAEPRLRRVSIHWIQSLRSECSGDVMILLWVLFIPLHIVTIYQALYPLL